MKKLLLYLLIGVFISGCTHKEAEIQNINPDVEEVVKSESLIELEGKKILLDKVEILIPKGFEIMPEEIAKLKYPTERRPTLIYTNESGSINVAFNYTPNKVTDEQIPKFKNFMKPMFTNLHPSATWYDDNVYEINGKPVGVFELLTPALDTEIYNLIFFLELDGRVLLATFNCTKEEMEGWKPVAKKILHSVKTF